MNLAELPGQLDDRAIVPDSFLPGGKDSMIREETLPSVNMELKNTNRMIVYFKVSGKTNREIAAVLGLDESTISRICKSAMVKQEILKLTDSIGKGAILDRLNLLRHRALDVVEDTLDHLDKKLALRSAEDILKMTGDMDRKDHSDSGVYRQILDELDDQQRRLNSLESVDGEVVEEPLPEDETAGQDQPISETASPSGTLPVPEPVVSNGISPEQLVASLVENARGKN